MGKVVFPGSCLTFVPHVPQTGGPLAFVGAPKTSLESGLSLPGESKSKGPQKSETTQKGELILGKHAVFPLGLALKRID